MIILAQLTDLLNLVLCFQQQISRLIDVPPFMHRYCAGCIAYLIIIPV